MVLSIRKNFVDKNSPEYLERKIAGGRSSLLLLLVFTLVNLVLLVLDAGYCFLFSASVPYYLTAFCMGMDYGMGVNFGTFTIIALVVSGVVLGIYLLCWILSKRHQGWLTVALVLFVVDTVGLLVASYLFGLLADSILDFAFHVWAVVSMAQAISASGKLKALAARQAQMAWQTPYDDSF